MGGVSDDATLSPLPSADRPDVAARLREAMLAASFTADGLLDLLGAPAYAALARSETVPALRATRGDAPLETLVRDVGHRWLELGPFSREEASHSLNRPLRCGEADALE